MLIPSVTPLKNSATIESQKLVDSPNTIMLTPKPATQMSSVRPACRLGGRRVAMSIDAERAERWRGPEQAQADRPDVEDVAGEDRQQRDRAAEEDGEQVQRHRADEGRACATTYRIPPSRLSRRGSPAIRSGIGRRGISARHPVEVAMRRAISP